VKLADLLRIPGRGGFHPPDKNRQGISADLHEAVPLERTLAACARGEPFANPAAFWLLGVQDWDREQATAAGRAWHRWAPKIRFRNNPRRRRSVYRASGPS
jgi:hypothetical protein